MSWTIYFCNHLGIDPYFGSHLFCQVLFTNPPYLMVSVKPLSKFFLRLFEIYLYMSFGTKLVHSEFLVCADSIHLPKIASALGSNQHSIPVGPMPLSK